MSDPQHEDRPGHVVDLDQHPVVASSRAAELSEVAGQRLAEPEWVVRQDTGDELGGALFTGFFVAYWVLAISGTSFRGPGQELMWPWDLPLEHH